MKHPDPRLAAYCDMLLAAPVSVTSIRDPERAWSVHIDDALAGVPLVERLAPSSIADVGSGGGSPGIPIALVTGIGVDLIEATGVKCDFLRRCGEAVGAPCEVIHDRSEHLARAGGRDAYDLVLARALAPPPVAAELCLPLARPGGHVLLWTAETEPGALAEVAAALGGEHAETVEVGPNRRLELLRKASATPERFPRRPGMAAKHPLVRVRSRP
ncbi:MAG TPA: RsmG family class I SAM-dependent methyltransferase [Gaiellales bacterium]|nr:RsmG family class I SAM-dependent methyltransferase [Gaiellales bacterium]